jgi:hypothetical protein
VSLANLGWVRQHFNANLDNLRVTDEQVATDEVRLFKHAGIPFRRPARNPRLVTSRASSR